jgi:hypothetical protein
MQNEFMIGRKVQQVLAKLGSSTMKLWIVMMTNKMIRGTIHGVHKHLDINLKYLLQAK